MPTVLQPVVVRSAPATFSRALLAVVLALASTEAWSNAYQLVYTGTFNASESLTPASSTNRTFFTAATPFTIRALFDDSTPSQVPPVFPFLGFVAYIPTVATIKFGGKTYNIATAATSATAGVTVAIFDRSQIFDAGRYGVGLIANALSDGAGIVGDFLSASPDFSVTGQKATTFTSYYGVGHSSGPCITGNPPNCPKLDTAWQLHDASNAAFSLLLGNYSEDYPALHPNSGATVVGPLNTAVITAVPEPATITLIFAGLAGVVGMVEARRRRRSG